MPQGGNPHLTISLRMRTSATSGARRDSPYSGGGSLLQNVISASAIHSNFALPYITGTTLTFFPVTGYIYDVEQPDPGLTTAQPKLANVSAFVDFFPGNENGPFPTGYALVLANFDHGDTTKGNTFVPLAPITGRMINGSLRSIAVGDPISVVLVSNSAIIGLPRLRYHVRFRNVTYGGASQGIANFAFDAPTDTTPIDLTSPGLVRRPYLGPA